MALSFSILPPTMILSPLICFSKKRLFEELALYTCKRASMEEQELIQAFNRRETQGSTVIADGVAIPHLLSRAEETFAALSILNSPVPFNSIDADNQNVDIALAFFFSPHDSCADCERLLEQVSRTLSDQELIKALRKSRHDRNKLMAILSHLDAGLSNAGVHQQEATA